MILVKRYVCPKCGLKSIFEVCKSDYYGNMRCKMCGKCVKSTETVLSEVLIKRIKKDEEKRGRIWD